jgi:hypothetical protein
MTIADGDDERLQPGLDDRQPSTADKTEMAGVIIASP